MIFYGQVLDLPFLFWYTDSGDNVQFKKIYIEITNTCNLACSFCIQNQRPASFMSMAQIEHIFNEIQPYGSYIYLHVLGEPLLHPHLDEILALAKARKLNVTITTNGTLLQQCLPNLLNGSIRQLNISLHNFSEHQHIDMKQYIQTVLQCADEVAMQGTYVSYRLWNMKNHILDQETMQVLHQIESFYAMTIPNDAILAGQSIRLNDRRFLNFEESFTWPSMQEKQHGIESTCLGLKAMIAILVDGSVVPCCLDSAGDCTLGNIYRDSLATILASEQAFAIREGFQQPKAVGELCKRCTYRLRFLKETI